MSNFRISSQKSVQNSTQVSSDELSQALASDVTLADNINTRSDAEDATTEQLVKEFAHKTVLLVETVNSVIGESTQSRKKAKTKYTKRKPIKRNAADDLDSIINQDADKVANSQLIEEDLPKKSGIFVDATFGRGGHSYLLLKHLDEDATLIVFDKDPQAIEVAQKLAEKDSRVIVIHESFATLQDSLKSIGIDKVDGIMADLGVSSPQLDDGSRGFSFMRDGAIDMRMDTSRGQSVGEWLKHVDEEVLADVLYDFGEERHSRRIARAIKGMDNYTSTLELAEVIKEAHPKWQKGKHPATQSFQAMRIFINNELGDIDNFLNQSLAVLAPNSWLAVISFHSLEDRRIKQFLQRHSRGTYPEDQNAPIAINRPKYFAKPNRIAPSKEEIDNNPRSRSAWLRVATRTDELMS